MAAGGSQNALTRDDDFISLGSWCTLALIVLPRAQPRRNDWLVTALCLLELRHSEARTQSCDHDSPLALYGLSGHFLHHHRGPDLGAIVERMRSRPTDLHLPGRSSSTRRWPIGCGRWLAADMGLGLAGHRRARQCRRRGSGGSDRRRQALRLGTPRFCRTTFRRSAWRRPPLVRMVRFNAGSALAASPSPVWLRDDDARPRRHAVVWTFLA